MISIRYISAVAVMFGVLLAPVFAVAQDAPAAEAAPAVHDEAEFCAFAKDWTLMLDEQNPMSGAAPQFSLSDTVSVTAMTSDCAARQVAMDIAVAHTQAADENGVDGTAYVNGQVCGDASPMKGALDNGWVMVAQPTFYNAAEATFDDVAQEMTIDCTNLPPAVPAAAIPEPKIETETKPEPKLPEQEN